MNILIHGCVGEGLLSLMFRGLYTAYTGMRTQQQKMDAISNNLANVDTAGYKKDTMVQNSFKEILTYKINDPELSHSENIGKMSLGVRVSQVYTDFLQGSLKQTNEQNNLAIQGTGFFKVGQLNDEGTMDVKFTRDGSFNLNQQGELVTNDGLFVLGGEDSPITLGLGDYRINKSGSIYQSDQLVGQMQVMDFEDLQSLRKEGSSLYRTTDASVEKAFEGTVQQGFIETSNANSIQEMVEMIATSRSYEANQKIIQTYDATMDKVVNSVGTVQ